MELRLRELFYLGRHIRVDSVEVGSLRTALIRLLFKPSIPSESGMRLSSETTHLQTTHLEAALISCISCKRELLEASTTAAHLVHILHDI